MDGVRSSATTGGTASQNFPETDDGKTDYGDGLLVFILHSYMGTPASLGSTLALVTQLWPQARIVVPDLPASMFSFADPNGIVVALLQQVDQQISTMLNNGTPAGRIILIGHSMGALLARKLYVVACGETTDAPFEMAYKQERRDGEGLVAPRPWADLVERIVLLAGMNRGWRVSHHLSLWRAPLWALGSAVGHVLALFKQRPPLIFSIRRGAEFITQLRIQWLMMTRARSAAGDQIPRPGAALTVQLLGSHDDLVSPEDNVDLVSGQDFVYLDVPYSGHADVVKMDSVQYGQDRRRIFSAALLESKNQLEVRAVVPSDGRLTLGDLDIKHVVFVVHGIRDAGFWTHKIARRVRQHAFPDSATWATETSSYGYFPMLPFLLPWHRRQRVEWLMDQYTEALARYPGATFSYVGHSNGTYLLAKALELYPCCKFDRVVFAGSVVHRDYEWKQLIDAKRVGGVLNLTATADWVVAFFPKLFQVLRWQDLGSAGHDGFRMLTPGLYERGPIRGGHGAAVTEPAWDLVAQFVLGGKVSEHLVEDLKGRQAGWVRTLGRCPPLVWLLIVAGIWAVWIGIEWLLAQAISDPERRQYVSGLATAGYILGLWLIVTRV